MYQPYVNKTYILRSDLKKVNLVTPFKLILLPSDAQHGVLCKNQNGVIAFPNEIKLVSEWINPIFISETEEIKQEDWYYYQSFGEHFIESVSTSLKDNTNDLRNLNSGYFYKKILAFGKYFSKSILNAIITHELHEDSEFVLLCNDGRQIFKDKHNSPIAFKSQFHPQLELLNYD